MGFLVKRKANSDDREVFFKGGGDASGLLAEFDRDLAWAHSVARLIDVKITEYGSDPLFVKKAVGERVEVLNEMREAVARYQEQEAA